MNDLVSQAFSNSVARAIFYSLMTVTSVFASAPSMTQEEATVRRAYAKVECAVQLGSLFQRVIHVKRPEPPSTNDTAETEQLTFELTGFRVGDLSDIGSTKYSELVTKPSGADGLFITPVIQNRREGDNGINYTTDMAAAHWEKEQLLLEDWNVPMVEAMKWAETNNSGSRFNRYASFAVAAKFQSRVRHYRALFLFGTDSKGNPFVLAIDTVMNINGGALSWFMAKPIVPDVFLNTSLKDNPVVRQWFENHRQTGCDSKATDICCDLVSMQCGWK